MNRNSGPTHLIAAAFAFFFSLAIFSDKADAMKIQQVKSPGGIEAWLVEEHSVPLIAMRFAVRGGSAQDPAGKEGVANFVSVMLDEGAGGLSSEAFQERMEELALRMSFDDARDNFYGSFTTLTKNRDAAFGLLQLALTKPAFEAKAMARMRAQLLAKLAFNAKDPRQVAARTWSEMAFGGHPYGRSSIGTAASLKAITGADLEAFRARIFARDNLKIVVVGDIDAKTLSSLLDKVFGGLTAKAELTPVAKTTPAAGPLRKVVEMNVPQSVAKFGHLGLARDDKDFMAAFVLNHIIGSGGFTSILMEEVREKRGLAYSVYSYLQPYRHAAVYAGSVATKNESIDESLDVIKSVLTRLAKDGPTAQELQAAKDYLTGSFALRFDTSAKIASQLLYIHTENLGLGYVENRNKLIEDISLADIKLVAARLLKTDALIVAIVGKPVKAKAKPKTKPKS